jgi:hypothetical protein
VRPEGGRYWHYRFYFSGKRKKLNLGIYPEISLECAKARHRYARNLVIPDGGLWTVDYGQDGVRGEPALADNATNSRQHGTELDRYFRFGFGVD